MRSINDDRLLINNVSIFECMINLSSCMTSFIPQRSTFIAFSATFIITFYSCYILYVLLHPSQHLSTSTITTFYSFLQLSHFLALPPQRQNTTSYILVHLLQPLITTYYNFLQLMTSFATFLVFFALLASNPISRLTSFDIFYSFLQLHRLQLSTTFIDFYVLLHPI